VRPRGIQIDTRAGTTPAGILLTLCLLLLLLTGCGRHETETPTRVEPSPEPNALLPEWAPEDPSEEFLRAARVLKPTPSEIYLTAADPMERAVQEVAWHDHILPRTWEMFGTLADEQVEHFLSAKEVFVKVTEMTPEQRAALQRLLDDFQGLEAGGQDFDLEVRLYKFGAREDLSNVQVGFVTAEGEGATHQVIFMASVVWAKPGDPHGTYGLGAIGHI
jgi:hypothetical protein